LPAQKDAVVNAAPAAVAAARDTEAASLTDGAELRLTDNLLKPQLNDKETKIPRKSKHLGILAVSLGR
jgi:hypothetical protein